MPYIIKNLRGIFTNSYEIRGFWWEWEEKTSVFEARRSKFPQYYRSRKREVSWDETSRRNTLTKSENSSCRTVTYKPVDRSYSKLKTVSKILYNRVHEFCNLTFFTHPNSNYSKTYFRLYLWSEEGLLLKANEFLMDTLGLQKNKIDGGRWPRLRVSTFWINFGIDWRIILDT